MKDLDRYIQLVFENYGWQEAIWYKEKVLEYADNLYDELVREREKNE